MSPSPDVLQRLRDRLNAGLLPAAGGALHRGPMVAPDGRQVSEAEALMLRAYRLDCELEILIELGRGPDNVLDLDRPISPWAPVVVLSLAVGLLVVHVVSLAFESLSLLVVLVLIWART